MGWIDINELIRELLAVKVHNEELTKRVERLELEVASLANDQLNPKGVRELYGQGYIR